MNKDFENKKVLVTGGTGFIGSCLVRELLALDAQVSILTRRDKQTSDLNVEFIIYDQVTIIDKLKETSFDIIFHLASKVGYSHGEHEISSYIDANITLGTQILEYIKVYSPLTIFINTGSFWEHQNGEREVDPLNLYACTKVSFQEILSYYSKNFNIKSLTLKLFDVYSLVDTRSKLINLIIDKKELDVTDGNQFVDFVHIDDVVNAFITATKFADSNSPKYSAASGNPIQLKELFSFFNSHQSNRFKLNVGAKIQTMKTIKKPYSGNILPAWKTTRNVISDIQDYIDEK